MKPMLIGLNNTHSTRPEDALVPWPPHLTGGRLVAMAIDVDDTFSEDEYMRSFERRNLWPYTEIPHREERGRALARRGRELRRQIQQSGREDAILLGTEVWRYVTERKQPSWFSFVEIDGCRYWFAPHPSGRSRLINDKKIRGKLGWLLVSLARMARDAEKRRAG